MKKKQLTVKRILYTLCFVVLCVIDQIKGSADGRVQMIAVNCTGFVMAAIILSAYKLKDFCKVPYLVWTIVFAIGGTIAYLWGKENYPYIGQWITGVFNVGIYGYILIRVFYKLVLEKNLPRLNKVSFVIWLVMMAGMILSKNEAIWPLWFLVMFGSFYVTDYDEEERNVLFGSLVDGLIIGFFLIQGAAFVFRPYDQLRYPGMYANANINGLFYAVTLCAFFCKWYQLKQREARKVFRAVVLIFAGSMYGFAFLTMGRTALLTMAVTTLFFLFYYAMELEKGRIKSILVNGMLLAATAVATFPLVFGCVRYLPPIFHHPIWFDIEYSEAKVHSWDPVDSEKYIDWDEFIGESFGRVLWFVDFTKEEARQMLRPRMVAYAAEGGETGIEIPKAIAPALSEDELQGSGIDSEHAVLTKQEDIENPILIRQSIHKYYLRRLNLIGHSQDENGFWLVQYYYAPHAHNIFIQIAFDFGVVSGVLFLGLGAWAYYVVVKQRRKKNNGWKEAHLLAVGGLATVLFAFGMFEMDWVVGQNIFTLYFVVQYFLYNKGQHLQTLLFEKSVAESRAE